MSIKIGESNKKDKVEKEIDNNIKYFKESELFSFSFKPEFGKRNGRKSINGHNRRKQYNQILPVRIFQNSCNGVIEQQNHQYKQEGGSKKGSHDGGINLPGIVFRFGKLEVTGFQSIGKQNK